MKKKNLALIIFLGFIFLVVLASLAVVFLKKKQPFSAEETKSSAQGKGEIFMSEENGFGDLSEVLSGGKNVPGVESKGVASSTLAGRGGGGDAMIYPPIQPIEDYKLVYVGGDFSLAKEKVQVLKRKKGGEEGLAFSRDFLNNFQGAIDLDLEKFENLKLSSFNVYEDRDFGLNFSFDLENASLYIGAQWDRWKSPEQECRGDQACYEKNRLTQKDQLPDEQALKIADDFLEKSGINRENYESGRLDSQRYYVGADTYIPEVVSVFYQQKVLDKKIFDQSGNPDGLRVEVDVRQKRVRGASPITNNDYFASDYAAETNRERIIEIAENGGWKKAGQIVAAREGAKEINPTDYEEPEYPFEEEKKRKEIKIGSPELGFIKIWNYANNAAQNEELFIPAYIFPVLEQGDNFWPKNIIVPAVKEK